MKTLKHVINWIVWSVIAINVLMMTLTHLPAFQSWLGAKVASIVSQKLGTEVTIGNVDVGFLNRLVVDNINLKDQAGQDLLHVGKLSARIELYPLTEGRIVLTSAQLFNAHANLYRKDSLTACNFQFVVDSLASRDTTQSTPLDLRINSLIIRQSSVAYNETSAPTTPDKFNTKHLKINDISAHILLKALTPDSIDVNVKRLTFKEQSGLSVNKLAFSFVAGTGSALLSNFYLQLPRSSLSIPQIVAQGDMFHHPAELSFAGSIDDTSIMPQDLSPLYPPLCKFRSPISLKALVAGEGRRFDLKQFELLSADGDIYARLHGWLQGFDLRQWDAHIDRISISANAVSTLKDAIPNMPEQIVRLGDISIDGDYAHEADGWFTANGSLSTALGNMKLNATMASDYAFKGHFDIDKLDVGQLSGIETLGTLSSSVDLQGTPQQQITAQGVVQELEYNGYTFQQINLDGSYSPETIAGHITVNDPNVRADLQGELHTGEQLSLRLTGNVDDLSPKALHLSDNWGNAVFSGNINADFTASNLNDARGRLDISNFQMADTTLLYRCSHLQVQSGYEDDQHFLKVNGDMGDAELRGRFDWNTVSQSVIAFVASKLPTLPGLPKTGGATDNDFSMRLHLYDATWLQRLFGVDLHVEQPASFYASVNDKLRQINVVGHLPRFSYNSGQYKDVNIRITSPGDTMKCDANLTKLSDNGRHMDMQVNAFAANNSVQTTLRWDNNTPSEAIKGQLSAITQLYRNESGDPEAHVSILPSHTTMGDAEWSIAPSDIVYSSGRLLIDHFLVTHDDQHILIDGIASANSKDTLIVDLNRVGVAYVLDLVDFTAVSFGGEATGTAFVTQAFNALDAWAHLTVDNFLFEDGRMGTLKADASWNKADGQIDIRAVADDGPEAKTLIDGFVSPTRDCIDLNIRGRGTYIDFLSSFTSSFLSNVTGHAQGDVKLVGPLGQMDLLGQLVVDGQATVTPLGTTYTLTKDTVRFVHDDIRLNHIAISDKLNNTGYITGGIHHKNLKQLTFDLDIETDRILAYDMPSTTDDLFYGNVVASGRVDMHGRPGEVVINCNATPLDGSVFTYNISNPDAINDQKFVTWQEASKATEDGMPLSATGEDSATDVPTDGTSETLASIPTDLYINFLLNVTDVATLRLLMDAKTADYITLAGNGVIRASYHNKGAFQMFGNYNVDHGTYGITIQNIIKKNFTFQPGGTIVFGGNPIDANLNLQALYTVNGVSLSDLSIGNSFSSNTVRVNCLMNILGQARAPRVEFDLDIPSVNTEEKQMIRSVITSDQELNQQVLYLLGVGRFYTQGVNNAATQRQYDQTQLAMQSFLSGTMSTQINEVLSQVLKTNNWNFGANISTGNEGWHNAEYEGIVSGQMLNNRLLINGQFGYRDNATQQTPSFIGDFDIRYLLTHNGNLALKVYNQTNDRYFTRSSLNTQGIGLILKKDFNGLKDLFAPRRRQQHATH